LIHFYKRNKCRCSNEIENYSPTRKEMFFDVT